MMGWGQKFLCCEIFCSPCPAIFSGSKTCFQPCPFVVRAAVNRVPAQHTSAPLLKSLSVAYPLQQQVTVHLSMPLPNTSADKVLLSLQHSFGWYLTLQLQVCCFLCACSLKLPELVDLPKSLLAWVCGFPTWNWGLLPWEEREPKNCNF